MEFYCTTEAQNQGLHILVDDLPKILSLSTNQTPTYAIRATSMAIYGKITGSEDFKIDARQWYAKGLETQRKSLARLVGIHDKGLPADSATCASTMFSIFHEDKRGKLLAIQI
jgi:hypothetical protein